jgi:hypothetical protein
MWRTVLVVAAVDRHHTRRVGQRERKHHQQHLAAEVATIDEVPVEDVPVRLCRPALRKLTESESLAAFGTAVYLHLGAREVFGVARLVRENVQQVRQLPVRVTNDRHAAVGRYLYHGATRQRMKVGRSLRHQPVARPITSAPPGATSHVWSGETCAGISWTGLYRPALERSRSWPWPKPASIAPTWALRSTARLAGSSMPPPFASGSERWPRRSFSPAGTTAPAAASRGEPVAQATGAAGGAAGAAGGEGAAVAGEPASRRPAAGASEEMRRMPGRNRSSQPEGSSG